MICPYRLLTILCILPACGDDEHDCYDGESTASSAASPGAWADFGPMTQEEFCELSVAKACEACEGMGDFDCGALDPNTCNPAGCTFDHWWAERCISGVWTCNTDFDPIVYPEGPADCANVFECEGTTGTESGTGPGTESGTDPGTESGTDPGTDPASSRWLVLSEICDHSDNDNVRYVELLNVGSSDLELSRFKLKRYSNGSTLAAEFLLPAGLLPPGGRYVVANDTAAIDPGAFEALFGRSAQAYTAVANGNGNDTYAVSTTTDTLVDVYGEIGLDGVDRAWFYMDSVAQRRAVTSGSDVWDAEQWTISPGGSSASPGS